MNFKENLKCCLSNPVCHFVALIGLTVIFIEGAHLYAHHKMDMDVDGYIKKFIRKNPEVFKKYKSSY